MKVILILVLLLLMSGSVDLVSAHPQITHTYPNSLLSQTDPVDLNDYGKQYFISTIIGVIIVVMAITISLTYREEFKLIIQRVTY